MTHLTGLTNLSELDLAVTEVTDAGLTRLKGLTNLSELDLSDTRVSDVGVNELRQTLPRLKIVRVVPGPLNRPGIVHIASPGVRTSNPIGLGLHRVLAASTGLPGDP